MTAWRAGEAGDELDEIVARFAPPRPRRPRPRSWGEETHACELLEGAFELGFISEVWIRKGESGEAIWQLLTTSSPPFKKLADDLDTQRRAELDAAWVAFTSATEPLPGSASRTATS
jgi:hypothetical protein